MNRVLTDIAIRNLKPGSSRREVPDAGARGLYCLIQPSGQKSFAVRYRFDGQPRKLTLQPGITLSAARKATADALYEVEQGRDPSATKRQAKQVRRAAAANTFRAVAEEYFRLEGGQLRTGAARENDLERLVYPTLGDRPITEIRRSDIVRLLDKIEVGTPLGIKGGKTQADRTLAYIRKILNWHATRSDDYLSPIVRGMARVKAKERARERILTDEEIRAVWRAANAMQGPYGKYVQFLLLTTARRSEASDMPWSELDGSDWTLPAIRNKTKVDLVRPLSAAAMGILADVPKLPGCDYVFSTDARRPISGFTRFKDNFDKACGVADWTLHDLRRTARSLMSRAGVDPNHAEQCLGHVIPGVRGVYDRHKYYAEKKQAFEALAALIRTILDGPRANVVSLRDSVR